MHRPETKIEGGVKVSCNNPSQQTNSIKTNVKD
jgi:hypothetical protein